MYLDGRVDANDEEHARAVKRKFVPPDCRLGGSVLVTFYDRKQDPCVFCPLDREVCGGRPQTSKVRADDLSNAAYVSFEAAGAYADLRARAIAELNTLCSALPD